MSCHPSFQKKALIGKGGFASCYEMYSVDDDSVYAGKIVHFSQKDKSKKLIKLSNEISVHKDLAHDNIVKFYSSIDYDQQIIMILELCDSKNASDLLERESILCVGDTKEIMRQLCLGVEYLHNKGIIHRDLKLSNILFRGNVVKIADFGLATKIKPKELKYKLCGTPNYIAPEILNKIGYSFPADVWSLGCILYAFLVGHPPFQGKTVDITYSRIKKGCYIMPKSIPVDLQALLKKLLSIESSRRPSISDIRFRQSNTCILFSNYSEFSKHSESSCIIEEKDSGCSVGGNNLISKSSLYSRRLNLLAVVGQLVDATPDNIGKFHKNIKSVKNVQITWVKSWHDYSHGFIYKLSDGTIAMLINSNTFAYKPEYGPFVWFCSDKGDITRFSLDSCQDHLKTWTTNLKMVYRFVSYFIKNKHKNKEKFEKDFKEMPTHIVYYKRLPGLLIMGLSDGSVQMRSLSDKSMVVCSMGEDEKILITFISVCRKTSSYYLGDALCSNKSFVEKLRLSCASFKNLLLTVSSSIYIQ